MVIEEVEAIWAAIAERDDWAPLAAKIDAVRAHGRFTATLGLGRGQNGRPHHQVLA